MREGPHSGAVAPKHRLVLETALLLQCLLCISQDAWVSMETTAEPATAVRCPAPSPMGAGPRHPGSAPHPPLGSHLWPLFLAFVSSPAVLSGAAEAHAACQGASPGHCCYLRPHFEALGLLLQRSLRGSATKQDRELTHKPGPRWDRGAVFSTTYCLPFANRSWGDHSSPHFPPAAETVSSTLRTQLSGSHGSLHVALQPRVHMRVCEVPGLPTREKSWFRD